MSTLDNFTVIEVSASGYKCRDKVRCNICGFEGKRSGAGPHFRKHRLAKQAELAQLSHNKAREVHMKGNCSKCEANMVKQCELDFPGKLPPCAQYFRELAQQLITQAASSRPQMPPSCSECPVLKPCELQYFGDRCFNRLRRHFLLA